MIESATDERYLHCQAFTEHLLLISSKRQSLKDAEEEMLAI